MSMVFDEMDPRGQMQVEQDVSSMRGDKPMMCGDEVEVTFKGRIVKVEEDVFDYRNKRLLITIKNESGDTVTVEESLVSYAKA